MKLDLVSKFKIPTLLGLGIILAGIAVGVFLTVKDQRFFTKASPSLAPQNLTISNVLDTQVTISYKTVSETLSFITHGIKNTGEQTVLDDRDTSSPTPRMLHYFTIKNLQPDTSFLFKIISGKVGSSTQSFKTAKSASFQNGFGPIRGTVFDGDKPLNEGIAYLSISNANIQSAPIKNLGNFLIPVSYMREADLSDTFQMNEETLAKLTIVSPKGEAYALFKLGAQGVQIPPIKLGESLDLTGNIFDINGDQLINSVDYSVILQNFGKNPKNRKADLNKDGIVDHKDLEELNKNINQAVNF